jgi:deazaflavin-dependent oxidoreductase (nitroreductase family)
MQVTVRTLGAKTGEARSATLYAWEDGDRLVLVGSRGGASRHPAWVHNLREHPEAVVVRGRSERRYRASESEGAERDRLWRLAVARFPLYARYAERTERMIPVFLLEPLD